MECNSKTRTLSRISRSNKAVSSAPSLRGIFLLYPAKNWRGKCFSTPAADEQISDRALDLYRASPLRRRNDTQTARKRIRTEPKNETKTVRRGFRRNTQPVGLAGLVAFTPLGRDTIPGDVTDNRPLLRPPPPLLLVGSPSSTSMRSCVLGAVSLSLKKRQCASFIVAAFSFRSLPTQPTGLFPFLLSVCLPRSFLLP